METAVGNFIEPGTKLALFVSGYFAERISEMASRHGAEIVRLEKPWGESFTADEAVDFIHRERTAGCGLCQAETSTGVFQRSKAICEAAHEVGAIVIADCVTSLGAMPVNIDENGIDVAYSCTQKGLSAPPGLSPITVSPRALERSQAAQVTQSAAGTSTSRSSPITCRNRTAITTPPRPRSSMPCMRRWRSSKRSRSTCASSASKIAHDRFVNGMERLGLRCWSLQASASGT